MVKIHGQCIHIVTTFISLYISTKLVSPFQTKLYADLIAGQLPKLSLSL